MPLYLLRSIPVSQVHPQQLGTCWFSRQKTSMSPNLYLAAPQLLFAARHEEGGPASRHGILCHRGEPFTRPTREGVKNLAKLAMSLPTPFSRTPADSSN